MNDTWNYLSDTDPAEGIPDEWVLERLRIRRNALIADCDWRMVADSPHDTPAWRVYRQALRDLPEATADPRQAAWPTSP